MSKLFPSIEFLDETFESIGNVLASMKESRTSTVEYALSELEKATSNIPETPKIIPNVNEINSNVVDLQEYRNEKLVETEHILGSDVLQSLSQEDRLAEARAMINDLAA